MEIETPASGPCGDNSREWMPCEDADMRGIHIQAKEHPESPLPPEVGDGGQIHPQSLEGTHPNDTLISDSQPSEL